LILAEAGGLLVLAPGVDLARLERDLTRMGFLIEHPLNKMRGQPD
jgi:hypothetical protein